MALNVLRKALSEKFSDFAQIDKDTDLDPIRSEGGFQTAVDAAKLLHGK